MSFLNLRGLSIERPRWTSSDPRIANFVDYLVRRGDLDRPQAQRLADDIVAGMLLELGDDYVGRMQRHVNGILRVRVELANRYNALLAHFGGRRGAVPVQLPDNLQPAAFRALFDQLNAHLEGFDTLKRHAQYQFERQALLNDVEGLRDPPEPGRRPSGRRRFEAEALEQTRSRELTGILGEQQVPERVQDALAAFRQRYFAAAPPGWEVGVQRVPAYGAGAAQARGLSDLDPAFAAEGYELRITTPTGQVIRPDGVIQGRGGGFVFLEWKQPFGVEPSGYYASLAGSTCSPRWWTGPGWPSSSPAAPAGPPTPASRGSTRS
jgi:hypothetical protein